MTPDTVLACPGEDCDSSNIAVNVITDLQANEGMTDVTKYRCRACGECFDETDAVYRERKIETLPRKDSIARALHDADPEDLATDGGSIQPNGDETGARSVDGTYRYTDDRTGEAMLACGECEQTWPEGRLENGRCPDCRGER